TTSRTSLCDESASWAARQSEMNWSRSNEVTMGSSQSIDSYVIPHGRRGVRISIPLNCLAAGAGKPLATLQLYVIRRLTTSTALPPDNRPSRAVPYAPGGRARLGELQNAQ